MGDTETRVLAIVVGTLLGFAVVWSTIANSPVVVIAAAVLLVVLTCVLIVAPDRMRLSGGGIEAQMERRQRERIEDVLESGLESPSTKEAKLPDDMPETTVMPVERGVGSTITKAAFKRFSEELITESAEWGWMIGQLGFKTVPRPRIEWTGDQPRIMYGKGDPEGPHGGKLTGTDRPGYDE